MKHLKRYNESLDNKEDIIEYIKLCFVEFYDKGEDVVFTEEFDDVFEMVIDEPKLNNNYGSDINIFIKYGEEITEFYKEVENCIEKVKIKYDIKTKFEYQYPPEGYIRIIFGEKKFV